MKILLNLPIVGISLVILASCSPMNNDEPREDPNATFFRESMNGEVESKGGLPGVRPEEGEEDPDLEIRF